MSNAKVLEKEMADSQNYLSTYKKAAVPCELPLFKLVDCPGRVIVISYPIYNPIIIDSERLRSCSIGDGNGTACISILNLFIIPIQVEKCHNSIPVIPKGQVVKRVGAGAIRCNTT